MLVFIKSAWSGKEKLSLVFWGYYISGQLGLALLVGTLLILIPSETAQIIAAVLLLLPYLIWASWSVWTCAYNVGQKYWGHAARAVVVISVMSAIRNLNVILE
ncbi:MAG: hypothetical protein JAY99_05665 [Candidatus Thiodiazotropha lotti]|uniref:Uncharacterized protein n=1 Tax=Candidatus Thiodiazotropha endoloripes TaxID=1818881 RepID=A0A1E2UL98_9GAMM|nr:hypothetical protein [Candidatus Thiodiazotropha endoloripes]MCG7899528.1 hypothetical protein [Candidatus Thiodiazotropha weberae]MCG7992927.1 hypothetical protein [Candidatus Thiodiazotropha lotti]MCG7903223.1 hypothetical protein [Candidatus Thiodiazotropha weberae]MCG7915612.1 hypothetical protein [Candidatus Thiodiazotropha weberae]MCG7998992.1 hypothetical protein [Candidatus Thiodiazotropha lotti]